MTLVANAPKMAVEIAGMRLKNPVMSASGCFGWGEEYARFFDLSQMGALVGKAVTPRPRPGNPDVRFCVTPEAVWETVSACRAACRVPLIPKLSPNTTDIVALARAAEESGADAVS